MPRLFALKNQPDLDGAPIEKVKPEYKSEREKNAAIKKLVSDTNFTISKLSDRAKGGLKEVDALTNTRHENDVMYRGNLDEEALNASRSTTGLILFKLQKAHGELSEIIKRSKDLDLELNDLEISADSPLRDALLKKIENTQERLNLVDERIKIEADEDGIKARMNSVRKALHPIQAPPREKPQKEETPFTATIPDINNANGKSFAEIEALRKAAHEKDLEGVITEDEVAEGIALANKEDELLKQEARLAEVSPARSREEENKRKEEQALVKGYYKEKTSGGGQYYATSHKGEFPGSIDLQMHEDTIADNAAREAQEKKAEALSKINFESIGITLSDIAEQISAGKIDSIEKLQAALNIPELTVALNELVPEKNHGKDILDFVGKKTLGLFGKPKFDKETARRFFESLTTKALGRAVSSASEAPSEKKPGLYRTVSGDNLVNLRRTDVAFKGDFADATPEEVLARNKAAELAKAEEEAKLHKPEFTKNTPTLSGDRLVRLAKAAPNSPYGKDKQSVREEQQDAAKDEEWAAMGREAVRKTAEGKADTAKQIYEVAATHLSSVQDRIRSGDINSTEELEEALNQTPRISYQDLLPPQVRYTTKLRDEVSQKKSGFFGAKYTFDKVLANDFVNDLRKSATNNSEKRTLGE